MRNLIFVLICAILSISAAAQLKKKAETLKSWTEGHVQLIRTYDSSGNSYYTISLSNRINTSQPRINLALGRYSQFVKSLDNLNYEIKNGKEGDEFVYDDNNNVRFVFVISKYNGKSYFMIKRSYESEWPTALPEKNIQLILDWLKSDEGSMETEYDKVVSRFEKNRDEKDTSDLLQEIEENTKKENALMFESKKTNLYKGKVPYKETHEMRKDGTLKLKKEYKKR